MAQHHFKGTEDVVFSGFSLQNGQRLRVRLRNVEKLRLLISFDRKYGRKTLNNQLSINKKPCCESGLDKV